MSFPAATLILSNAVSKEHQGVAASLVNTVVNYSISLGLGFAGTVEVHVNNGGRTQQDLLRGYRGAFYMGELSKLSWQEPDVINIAPRNWTVRSRSLR
jgi:hypothetical protein